ncbi:unnamed protein product, partial [Rotaria sordida]
TTTTDTTTTTTTTGPAVNVMYPKDMEKACQQPVIIMNTVSMLAMVPVQAIGMFVCFSKFATMFDPSKIQAKKRYAQRLKKLNQR